MPRGIEALVEPRLLVWARDSAGLDVQIAARKAQVKPEHLERWERGEGRPTIPQLRKLGRVYRRPIAVFYLPDPPVEFQALRDFRRLPGVVAGRESPELRLELRQAQNRREFALDLYGLLEATPPAFQLSASLSDDAEEVANAIRVLLRIRYEDQMDWRPGYDAFNHWRSALEVAGVLVFQAADAAVSEMRGFSVYAEQLPSVIVNLKDSVSGRIFSMLHELAHLALHEGGLCDLAEEFLRPDQEGRVEVFCNRVAGATLVPREYLLLEDTVAAKAGGADWADHEIRYLADRYGCSREVVLRRLLICGRTTEDFYRKKREQLLEEFEAEEARREEGFAPPHRMAVSSAGHLFVRLVLDNYYQGNITASDVAEFLGVRLKHLGRIESAVVASSA